MDKGPICAYVPHRVQEQHGSMGCTRYESLLEVSRPNQPGDDVRWLPLYFQVLCNWTVARKDVF